MILLRLLPLALLAACSSTPEYDLAPGRKFAQPSGRRGPNEGRPVGKVERGTVQDFHFPKTGSRSSELGYLALGAASGSISSIGMAAGAVGPARTTPCYIIKLDSGRTIHSDYFPRGGGVLLRGDRVIVRTDPESATTSIEPEKPRRY